MVLIRNQIVVLSALAFLHCGGSVCSVPQSETPSFQLLVLNATDSSNGAKDLERCQAKVSARKNGRSYHPQGIVNGCDQVKTQQDATELGIQSGETVCACMYTLYAGGGNFSASVERQKFQTQVLNFTVDVEKCPGTLGLFPTPHTDHEQVTLAPLPVTGG